MDNLLKIWAKSDPYHPLLYHMIDVGNIALALLSTKTFEPVAKKFEAATGCPKDGCKAWMAYLTALHDIGKCDQDFQILGGEELTKPLKEIGLKFRGNNIGYFLHEAQSYEFLRDYLHDIHGWDCTSANTAAKCALGHHSRFDYSDLDDYDGRTGGGWKKMRDKLADQIKNVFGPTEWASEDFQHHSNAGMLLLGLTVLSDWIASNTTLMPVHNSEMDSYSYTTHSYAQAKKAVSSLGFDDSINWEKRKGFKDVWRSDAIRDTRPVQAKCEEVMVSSSAPGLVIIEAPMGEGKTEAAIYMATRFMSCDSINGCYFALPTAATSNQMYERVVSFLSCYDNNIASKARLVHAMSWMIDETTPDCTFSTVPGQAEFEQAAYEWFMPKKRGLLSPYAVGTVDQALMSVLNVRFGFLRMLGLSGKVLIVDEVHAYDAYMASILERLLAWCSSLRIPVILLSATLPRSKRMSLISAYAGKDCNDCGDISRHSYPLITVASPDGTVKEFPVESSSRKKRIELQLHPGLLHKPEAVAQLALKRSTAGGCICVIANTVKSAQLIHQAIKVLKPDDCELMLFHARYRAVRRQEIEKQVLGRFDKTGTRPQKAILVATQVVEQSLDIDFDEMISEIAPVDLLLQRVGRLHRHERTGRLTGDLPRMHILLPETGVYDFGSVEKVYFRYYLLRTLSVINRTSISIPDDIPCLVESVYSEMQETGMQNNGIVAARLDMDKKMDEEKQKAGNYLIRWPESSALFLDDMAMRFTYEDEDGDASSYFNARTRSGNDSIQVLILDNDDYSVILSQKKSPGKDVIRSIMGNQASIPKWWIHELSSTEGYTPIQKAPVWLSRAYVLRMKEGLWKGKTSRGSVMIIRDDPVLGVVRKETEDDNGNI